MLCPRLCQQPCWFLRCILFPAEADCLSLFRVPFGLGPARSSWVPWARPSQYGAHQAAPELRDITFVAEERERNTSVALGCSPSSSLCIVRHANVGADEAMEAGALALLCALAELLVPLARALCGIVFLVLCKLLTRGMCWRATPMGKIFCFPLSGTRCCAIYALGAAALPAANVLTWGAWRDRKGRIRQRQRVCRPPFLASHGSMLPAMLVCSLPACIWAAPSGLEHALSEIHALTEAMPEPLPDAHTENAAQQNPIVRLI